MELDEVANCVSSIHDMFSKCRSEYDMIREKYRMDENDKQMNECILVVDKTLANIEEEYNIALDHENKTNLLYCNLEEIINALNDETLNEDDDEEKRASQAARDGEDIHIDISHYLSLCKAIENEVKYKEEICLRTLQQLQEHLQHLQQHHRFEGKTDTEDETEDMPPMLSVQRVDIEVTYVKVDVENIVECSSLALKSAEICYETHSTAQKMIETYKNPDEGMLNDIKKLLACYKRANIEAKKASKHAEQASITAEEIEKYAKTIRTTKDNSLAVKVTKKFYEGKKTVSLQYSEASECEKKAKEEELQSNEIMESLKINHSNADEFNRIQETIGDSLALWNDIQSHYDAIMDRINESTNNFTSIEEFSHIETDPRIGQEYSSSKILHDKQMSLLKMTTSMYEGTKELFENKFTGDIDSIINRYADMNECQLDIENEMKNLKDSFEIILSNEKVISTSHKEILSSLHRVKEMLSLKKVEKDKRRHIQREISKLLSKAKSDCVLSEQLTHDIKETLRNGLEIVKNMDELLISQEIVSDDVFDGHIAKMNELHTKLSDQTKISIEKSIFINELTSLLEKSVEICHVPATSLNQCESELKQAEQYLPSIDSALDLCKISSDMTQQYLNEMKLLFDLLKQRIKLFNSEEIISEMKLQINEIENECRKQLEIILQNQSQVNKSIEQHKNIRFLIKDIIKSHHDAQIEQESQKVLNNEKSLQKEYEKMIQITQSIHDWDTDIEELCEIVIESNDSSDCIDAIARVREMRQKLEEYAISSNNHQAKAEELINSSSQAWKNIKLLINDDSVRKDEELQQLKEKASLDYESITTDITEIEKASFVTTQSLTKCEEIMKLCQDLCKEHKDHKEYVLLASETKKSEDIYQSTSNESIQITTIMEDYSKALKSIEKGMKDIDILLYDDLVELIDQIERFHQEISKNKYQVKIHENIAKNNQLMAIEIKEQIDSISFPAKKSPKPKLSLQITVEDENQPNQSLSTILGVTTSDPETPIPTDDSSLNEMNGLEHLLRLSESISSISRLSKLFKELCDIFNSFQCIQTIANLFNSRLYRFTEILYRSIKSSTNTELLPFKILIYKLSEILYESKKYFIQFTKINFLSLFLQGNAIKEKFDYYDDEIFALVPEFIKILGGKVNRSHNQIPPMKYSFMLLTEDLILSAHNDSESLKSLSKILETNPNLLQHEIQRYLSRLDYFKSDVNEEGVQKLIKHPAIRKFWRRKLNHVNKLLNEEFVDICMSYISEFTEELNMRLLFDVPASPSNLGNIQAFPFILQGKEDGISSASSTPRMSILRKSPSSTPKSTNSISTPRITPSNTPRISSTIQEASTRTRTSFSFDIVDKQTKSTALSLLHPSDEEMDMNSQFPWEQVDKDKLRIVLFRALRHIDENADGTISVFEIDQATKHLNHSYDFIEVLLYISLYRSIMIIPSIHSSWKRSIVWGTSDKSNESMKKSIFHSLTMKGLWTFVYGPSLVGKTFRYLLACHEVSRQSHQNIHLYSDTSSSNDLIPMKENPMVLLWIDLMDIKTPYELLSAISYQLSLHVLSLDDIMLEFQRLLEIKAKDFPICVILDHLNLNNMPAYESLFKILKKLNKSLKITIVLITQEPNEPNNDQYELFHQSGRIPSKLMQSLSISKLSYDDAISMAQFYDVFDSKLLVEASLCLPGRIVNYKSLSSVYLTNIIKAMNEKSNQSSPSHTPAPTPSQTPRAIANGLKQGSNMTSECSNAEGTAVESDAVTPRRGTMFAVPTRQGLSVGPSSRRLSAISSYRLAKTDSSTTSNPSQGSSLRLSIAMTSTSPKSSITNRSLTGKDQTGTDNDISGTSFRTIGSGSSKSNGSMGKPPSSLVSSSYESIRGLMDIPQHRSSIKLGKPLLSIDVSSPRTGLNESNGNGLPSPIISPLVSPAISISKIINHTRDFIIAENMSYNEALCAWCLYYPFCDGIIFNKSLGWTLCCQALRNNIDIYHTSMNRLVEIGWLRMIHEVGYYIASDSCLPNRYHSIVNDPSISESHQWNIYYKYLVKEVIRINTMLQEKEQLLACSHFDSSRKHFDTLFSNLSTDPVLHGSLSPSSVIKHISELTPCISNILEYRIVPEDGLHICQAILRILCQGDDSGKFIASSLP